MLTTLVSTPATGPGEFTYVVDASHTYELNYNNVTFEAVAGLVDTTTGQEGAGDLQQTPITTPDAVESYLYKIYVTSATAGSYISVSELDTTTGNLIPFNGDTSGFLANSPKPVNPLIAPAIPSGTGTALIGAVSVVTGMLIPSIQLQQSIGVMPAPAGGALTPGIQVLAVDPATGLQNDIGNIVIGGTVTGSVSIGGNINEFYAGAVLTGNVDGASYENQDNGQPTATLSEPTPPTMEQTPTTATAAMANFTVGGDIGAFVSLGPVGTDQASPIDTADYLTDFVMSVGGTVGSIQVGNVAAGQASNFYGAVLVANDPAVARQTAPVITTANPFQVLGSLNPSLEVETLAANDPDNVFGGGEVDLRNETQYEPGTFGAGAGSSDLGGVPADLQMLGATPKISGVTNLPVEDESGNIVYQASVDGDLQETLGDTIDQYGVALRAGETITALAMNIANPPGVEPTLDIFDPDGREVVTNAIAGATPLQYTPDRPGIYTFEVTGGNGTDLPYNLTVTGVPDTAIGGITVDGNYSDIGLDGAISAGRGDIGGIAVGVSLASLTLGPTNNGDTRFPLVAPSSIVVAAGNLDTVIAGSIGLRPAGGTTLQSGPYLSVPAGDVGLLRATGGAAEGVLDVHSRFDPNYMDLATPQFVTDDAAGWAIGGSIQTIDAASTFEGELAVNRGIGTLRATDLATDTPSYFDLNADNAGQDGIFDLIDVSGSFGDATGGGPAFVTHDGGDIRYMHLTGAIFIDNQFGGGPAPVTTYPIGQVATFTDDAGNTVSLTPVGQVQTSSGTVVTGSPITTPPSPTQTSDLIAGPQIQLVTYPIRDKGGEVPVSVTSTGGLVVTGKGTSGSSSQVEIGSITVEGLGRDVVRTGLTDAFGNATIFQPDPNDPNADLVNDGAAPGPNTDTGATTNSVAAINTGSINTSTGTSTPTGGTSPAGGNTGTGTGSAGTGGTGLNGNGATGSTGTTNPTGGALSSSGSIEPGASDIDVSAVGGTSVLATAEGNPTDLIVILQGSATVSVFSLTTTNSAVTVADTTPGEIVNFTAPGVGSLQVHGNLGFAAPHATPAAVYPRAVIPNGDTYPFVEQATGVVIGTGFLAGGSAAATTGYAVDVRVGGAIANFQAGLTVQSMIANADGVSTPGQVDGIDGPVVVGRVLALDVGQGVLPTGTGTVGLSGVFATYKLGVIDNYGNPNGDIRGNLVSAQYDAVTDVGIDSVQVRNASIIHSKIVSLVAPALGTAFGNPFDVVNFTPQIGGPNDTGVAFANPFIYDVGSVAVAGDGGIIGSEILAQNIGPVLVTGGGFGILTSTISAGTGGRIASIVASGYGIRDTPITAGFLGPVTASGSGALVPTTVYPIDVRPSDDGNGVHRLRPVLRRRPRQDDRPRGSPTDDPAVPDHPERHRHRHRRGRRDQGLGRLRRADRPHRPHGPAAVPAEQRPARARRRQHPVRRRHLRQLDHGRRHARIRPHLRRRRRPPGHGRADQTAQAEQQPQPDRPLGRRSARQPDRQRQRRPAGRGLQHRPDRPRLLHRRDRPQRPDRQADGPRQPLRQPPGRRRHRHGDHPRRRQGEHPR